MNYTLNTRSYPSTDKSIAVRKALEELGFGKCYHMRTAMNQYPHDCAMWFEAFEAKYDGSRSFERQQWDQLLGKYSVRIESLAPTPKRPMRPASTPRLLMIKLVISPSVTCQR